MYNYTQLALLSQLCFASKDIKILTEEIVCPQINSISPLMD